MASVSPVAMVFRVMLRWPLRLLEFRIFPESAGGLGGEADREAGANAWLALLPDDSTGYRVPHSDQNPFRRLPSRRKIFRRLEAASIPFQVVRRPERLEMQPGSAQVEHRRRRRRTVERHWQSNRGKEQGDRRSNTVCACFFCPLQFLRNLVEQSACRPLGICVTTVVAVPK